MFPEHGFSSAPHRVERPPSPPLSIIIIIVVIKIINLLITANTCKFLWENEAGKREEIQAPWSPPRVNMNRRANHRSHASRVHFAKIHFGKVNFDVKKSLVMVSTSLVTVATSLALLGGHQRRLLDKNTFGKYTFEKYALHKSAKVQISVKNSVWGPVEWVGDQLTGWGGSSQKQNSKINGLCFFNFFDLSDRCWPEIGNPKVWRTNQPTNGRTYMGRC